MVSGEGDGDLVVGAGGNTADHHAVAELRVADPVAGVEAGRGPLGGGVSPGAHSGRRGPPRHSARHGRRPIVNAARRLIRIVHIVPAPEARGAPLRRAAAEAAVGAAGGRHAPD